MIGLARLSLFVAMLFYALPLLSREATAFDLTGAWALKADQCSKVFAHKGRAKRVGLTSLSGAFGGGFIVEADRLRSKFDACSIRARKEDGRNINLVVACAKGGMFANMQFFLNVIDDNTITRQFPGVEGMDVTYHRCTI